MSDSEQIARVCAQAADGKKAEAIAVLDVREISSFTDFFVICSGTSDPHLKAIASSIRETVREQFGVRPFAEDGIPASQWVVIDFGSVVVHIFHAQKREWYALENLWSDAPRLEFELSGVGETK